VVAFSTLAATVTTPPPAERLPGVAPADKTTGTPAGAGAPLAHAVAGPPSPPITAAVATTTGTAATLNQVILFFTPAQRGSST
jgi:hypothetical protein